MDFVKYALLAAAAVILLTSCALPGERKELPLPVKVPGTWQAKKAVEGEIQGEWWRQFNDPELIRLVEEALKNNADIQCAAARVQAASAQARIEGADLLPKAGLATGAGRARNSTPAGPHRGNQFEVVFSISWEIDLWGRARAGQRAAIQNVEVAKAEHQALRLSVAAQVTKAWFGIQSARQHVHLARSTVDSYLRSLRIVTDRFQRGVTGSLDVRFASTNLASAEALLERRQEQLDRLVRRLETILGRYPQGVLTSSVDMPPLPPEVPVGLPSDLLNRRPDLAAAKYRIFSSDARVFQAEASLLPKVSLTSAGGLSSTKLTDLFDLTSTIWNLASNLLAPLFEGGKLRANVELQKSRTQEAVEYYAKVALNAFREVETALAAEKFLDAEQERLEEAVVHAKEARSLAENRYQAGLAGILTVLEAQRRELDTKSHLLNTHQRCLDNRVDLHLALGGEF